MGFGSNLADIILGPRKMGAIRQNEDDRKMAAFLANPTGALPQGLNDPANVVKLQDFIKQQEVKTGTENAFKELAPFLQPSKSSLTPGRMPTQQEFVTDASQWAQGQGMDMKYALPMINTLKEQGSFQAAPAVPKVENFSGTPYIVDGTKLSVAPGFVQTPKEPRIVDWGYGQKKNLDTGEIYRIPTAPQASGSPSMPKPPSGYRYTASGELEAIPGGPAAQKGTARKPMPPTALRMQQDAVDALSTAENISADLGAMRQMVESGDLDLGPIENAKSSALNFLGASSQNSRNYSSFKATLEKLRNDSLRLNKGVQTDGDAVRAWKELLDNINDPGVVVQRLAEIEQINQRGAALHALNLENIRNNYGLDELDTTTQRNPKPAVGKKPAAITELSDDEILKQLTGE